MRPDDHAWRVLRPTATGTSDALDAVRRFRGRILFDDGRRPAFDGPTGPYDADPLDPVTHHVVAHHGGDPAREPQAALRVLPLTGPGADGDAAPGDAVGVCDRLLGPGTTADLLARLDLDPAVVWEGSGWAVRPGPGRARLAALTLAAGVAAARDLGRVTLIGVCGTRYGQLHRVLAAGLRRAEGTRPVPVPELADDLQVVHGSLDDLTPGFRALVDATAPAPVRPAPAG